MNVIALAGFKHVGKSYYGNYFSQKFNIEFIDLDWMLEKKFGMPVKKIYQELGKELFHEQELLVLKTLDFSSKLILALGGATLFHKQTLEFLKSHCEILHLEHNFKTLKDRIFSSANLWAALDPEDLEGSFLAIYLDRIAYLRALELKTFFLEEPQEIQLLEEHVRKFFW